MRSRLFRQRLTVGALFVLALPLLAHAQEATLSGTVTDTTGGALPGVTVQALHEASGNSFEAVTDERGEYRIPARVGAYRVTAALAGFAPATRTVTLLVGQQAVVDLQMGVSGLQESVTVTGEAPLLDVTQSSLGGNIDPRQVQELPVQGRNWLDLVVLAPGARVNAVGEAPSEFGASGPSQSRIGGDFQLNVDGQQITQLLSGAGNDPQPRFSRDAIAEFEFLSSRFDATQGRSSGIQVNVVTKSGTNTPSGSFAGYFRDDRFNAADFVAERVLEYQNQQLSGTFGGPIRRDRLHFFANYEYEREPQTALYTTPFPHFNADLNATTTQKKGGGRLDAQFSPRTRLTVRGNLWRVKDPLTVSGGADSTPSGGLGLDRKNNQLLGTLTQVLSNRLVNEVRVGYNGIEFFEPTLHKASPFVFFGTLTGPEVLLRGLEAGGPSDHQLQTQDNYSVRDDLTYSFTKGGRHAMKLGGEFIYQNVVDERCTRCAGVLDAEGGPIPANIESLFPDLFDVNTWNLAPLSPIAVRWRQTLFDPSDIGSEIPRYSTGLWVQDDWTISSRLTVNLGLRYDLELNAFGNDVKLLPFLTGDQPDDTNNVAPRLGFSLSANDRTVIRGGYGVYFATITNNHFAKFYEQTINLAIPNDGRPDFASNPWNGPTPSFESLLARVCTPALLPGCIRREVLTGGVVLGPTFKMPYSHQASVGVQRQLGATMAIEADYVYTGNRDQQRDLPVNLSFNPETGANFPFRDISRRPFPEWGYISLTVNGARANYHALQTAFTKRFSGGWQASGTYTLSALRDAGPLPMSGLDPVPFETAPDLGGEYGLSTGDQRHRAVLNGIWELPYGFQVSGLYFFGSGTRFDTRWGTDLRQIGSRRPNEQRLRPDGTLVARNSFVGDPLHRVDFRAQRRFPLGGRAGIDGILEVFNVFNHANFGGYVTQEVSRSFGRPTQNRNVAYFPRTMQLGFRFAF